MPTILVWDDGTTPIVKAGNKIPHERGGYYMYEDVSDRVAKYWNALPDSKKAETQRRARKENKDIRELIESLA